MFEIYVFQILHLLTECVTHCLVISFTDLDRDRKSLCALSDIVDAYEPIRHSRSLRALSDIVGAFEPYRT